MRSIFMGFGPRSWVRFAAYLVCGLSCQSVESSRAAPAAPQVALTRNYKEVSTIYAKGLRSGWQDWGWAPRDISEGSPAAIDFSSYGGWIIHHGDLTRQAQYATRGVVFRLKAPESFGDFLEVSLSHSEGGPFPGVVVPLELFPADDAGWRTVRLAIEALNPNASLFSQIKLRAHVSVAPARVLIDDLAFVGESVSKGAAPPKGAKVATHEPPTRDLPLLVQCAAPTHGIRPAVFGIAFEPRLDHEHQHVWKLNPPARRWGGNPTSRFNWKLGAAWNTAADWYFLNVNYSADPHFHWSKYLEENRNRGLISALTVPMMGWVAKDTKSYSFPVSVFGPQQSVEPSRPDAGNGMSPAGKPLKPLPPGQTSVAMGPDDVGAWVSVIKKRDQDAKKGRSVHYYLLDNEPMLWNSTHRDVHPEAVGYDELLERTVATARAIRKADPDAKIVGPNVWGWPAYLFSAKDAEAGFFAKPDRRAHGDVPLIPWYLRELAKIKKRTGEQLIDVLGVHFYPQTKGVFTNGQDQSDPVTAALRIRATRSLWDPSYKDESWIDDTVQLFPRLRGWIKENFPGLTMSIGEYNFGAENHISGGIALAEALGRFTQQPDLESAYYWTYPPEDSPAFLAFKAYRNFDGRGAAFETEALPTTEDPMVSLFAAQSETGQRLTLVLVNKDSTDRPRAVIDLAGCGKVTGQRAFAFEQGSLNLDPASSREASPGKLEAVLPAWSVTVVEAQLEPRGGAKRK